MLVKKRYSAGKDIIIGVPRSLNIQIHALNMYVQRGLDSATRQLSRFIRFPCRIYVGLPSTNPIRIWFSYEIRNVRHYIPLSRHRYQTITSTRTTVQSCVFRSFAKLLIHELSQKKPEGSVAN